jgi:hypothetical protein
MPGTWTEVWDRADGLDVPVAATLPDAAALLGVSLAVVEQAARHVPPYVHADGSPRWSVGELADRLGLADHDRKGHRRSWRTGGRFGEGRRHTRLGAAATNGGRAAELADAAARLAAVEDLIAGEQ